jgi:hypothetical protein
MRLVPVLVLFSVLAVGEGPQGTTCAPADDTEHTRWGHDNGVIDLQAKPVKALRGTVRAAHNQPVNGVLVEVYGYREGDTISNPDDMPSRPRISACVTDATGAFGFRVPSGRYEVRVSGRWWDTTSALVVVDTRKGRKGGSRSHSTLEPSVMILK